MKQLNIISFDASSPHPATIPAVILGICGEFCFMSREHNNSNWKYLNGDDSFKEGIPNLTSPQLNLI